MTLLTVSSGCPLNRRSYQLKPHACPRDSSPIMAHSTASAPLDADNKFGSLPAVHSDWPSGVADFHLGTGLTAPTSDAGYTTASELLSANRRSVSTCGGSPY